MILQSLPPGKYDRPNVLSGPPTQNYWQFNRVCVNILAHGFLLKENTFTEVASLIKRVRWAELEAWVPSCTRHARHTDISDVCKEDEILFFFSLCCA